MADRRSLAAKIGAGAAAAAISLVTVWEGYMPMLSTPDALRTWCKRAIRKARSFCGSSPNGTSCRFLGAPSAVEVSASKNTARDTIFFRDVNPCASVRSPQRTTRVSRLSSSVGPSTIIRFVVTVIVNSIYRKIIVIAGRQCPNFELFVCFPCRANLYSAAIISCISDARASCVNAAPYLIKSCRAVAMCSSAVTDGRPRSSASTRSAFPVTQVAAAKDSLCPTIANTSPKCRTAFRIAILTQNAPATETIAGEINESWIFSHA